LFAEQDAHHQRGNRRKETHMKNTRNLARRIAALDRKTNGSLGKMIESLELLIELNEQEIDMRHDSLWVTDANDRNTERAREQLEKKFYKTRDRQGVAYDKFCMAADKVDAVAFGIK
jgi:hypothetical protein